MLFLNRTNGGFILMSKTKETLKSSNLIDQVLKIEPQGFTLGFTYKTSRNIVVPKWQKFGGKFLDPCMVSKESISFVKPIPALGITS